LADDVAIPLVILADEIAGRGLSTKLTVDARTIDVVSAGDVLRNFFGQLGHGNSSGA
jgi:hypothetical protein